MSNLRRELIELSYRTQQGHLPSSFSVLDILEQLYGGILKIDPQNPKAEDRDRFVLSKGHAAIGLYAVLARAGFFHVGELESFGKPGSIFHGLCNDGVPGVEAATGSLGMGFPMAVGMALALRIKHLKPPRVFCLVGDGEFSEGSCWEAATLAAHLKLENLLLIVDANSSNPVKFPIAPVLRELGFGVYEVRGTVPSEFYLPIGKPVAIVRSVPKGYGCQPMVDNPGMWHSKKLTEADRDALIAGLT